MEYSAGMAVHCAAKILKSHGIFLWDFCVPDPGAKDGCEYFVTARFVTPLGRGRTFKAGPYDGGRGEVDAFEVAAAFQRMCDGIGPEREAVEAHTGSDACSKSLPASRAALVRDAKAEKELLWKCAVAIRAAASFCRLGDEAGRGLAKTLEEAVLSGFQPAPMEEAEEEDQA